MKVLAKVTIVDPRGLNQSGTRGWLVLYNQFDMYSVRLSTVQAKSNYCRLVIHPIY